MGKCVHAIPGRARFRVPAIRDSLTVAKVIARRLRAIDGVQGVEVRQSSASIVVRFDPDRVELAHLADAVAGERDHFHVPGPVVAAAPEARRSGASPLLVGAARHFGVVASQAAFKVMLEKAVSHGVSSLLRSTPFRL